MVLRLVRTASQAGHEHCHLVALCGLRMRQGADVILDPPEHREIILVEMQDMHTRHPSRAGRPISSA